MTIDRPKHVQVLAGLVGALLCLAGCQRETAAEPADVSGRFFIFNYRVAQARYMVTLRRNTPLPAGAMVVTTFEDPRGGAPLVTRSKIYPSAENIVLESPPVHCIVKDRPYSVTIRIVDSREALLQSLETTVVASLDQTVLTAKPLVVGPGYALNPDILRPDGTVDYTPETGCPATDSGP